MKQKNFFKKILSAVLLSGLVFTTLPNHIAVVSAEETPTVQTSANITIDDDFVVLKGVSARQTLQVTAGKTPVYTSSDEKVATVSANGMITAVSTGLATVTVTDGSTSKEIKVTVIPNRDREGRVKVGLQLYNLLVGGDLPREGATKDQVIDAFRTIASLGYDGVEFVNLSANEQYYGMDIAELKSIMDELGLETVATHYHYNWLDSIEKIDQVVAANMELGCKNIIFAFSNPKNPVEQPSNEAWVDFINEVVGNMQARIKAAGADIQAIYHNHGDEFLPYKDGSDSYCLDEVKADTLETDMYWASRGLNSPDAAIQWANDNIDKISFLHIKDGGLDGSIMPWGKGQMPVQKFVDIARNNHLEWVVVENDKPNEYNASNNGLLDAAVSSEFFMNHVELDFSSPEKGSVLNSGKNRYKVIKKGSAVAFAGITGSTSTITIPDSVEIRGVTYKVTSIAAGAFKGNKKLTKITVGKNVTSIGKNAFQNCSKLKAITIKSTKLKTVGANTFKGIHRNAKIKVPTGKLKAYSKLLNGKGQASTVKISK